MSQEPSPLPPYTSRTWWLSDGRAVLRFRPRAAIPSSKNPWPIQSAVDLVAAIINMVRRGVSFGG